MTDDREMEAWVEKLDKTNPAMGGKIRQLLDEIYRLRDEVAKARVTSTPPPPKPPAPPAHTQTWTDPILAKGERQIIAFMIQGPEFCSAVQRSGALLRFSSWDRRQAAEEILAGVVAHAKHDDPLQAAWALYDDTGLARFLAAVDNDKERTALVDEMNEVSRGGPLLADLEKKLGHFCRIAEEHAARRRVARALRV